ncbi:S8 family serine peptidase [Candidatus Woesearchaeota archaeon]|nr:S8 family serine peptidase [Candidatus Woesearchaeota archaeon]
MNKIKITERAAYALLIALLLLLAASFLPLGNGGSGSEKAVLLLQQIEAVDNLPPAVDEKIEPAVKEQVKEAIYLAAAGGSKEAAEKRKVEVLVKASSEDAKKVIKKAGGEILNVVDSVDKTAKYFAVKADADKVAAIAAGNDVSSISQRSKVYPTLDSSVPVIKADSFWNAGFKGSGVRVAVLDTGIDKNHPMLKDKVDAERDFTGSGTAADDCGHGTHVAGIVAGSKANGGYDGVAPDAKLLNAKVLTLNSNGECEGNVDYIIAAIGWALDPDGSSATDDGAKVISMSLGGKGETSMSLENELQSAVAKGAVVVVSSGNCGKGCPSPNCGQFQGVTWPGNSPSVITVGAVDDSKNVACFSSGENVKNVGIKPDFAAPGVDVMSSVPGGYESKRGTSMAAPHVSGAAALMLGKDPSLKQDDVKRILENTALDLGEIGKDTSYGFGLIDMAKALVYKEGLEFSIGLEKQIISGSSQKITVTVYDDVQVNSVKATVTKPNGAKSAEFTFAGSGSNVYTYDYTDTVLMGNYAVEVAVNYGGTSGSSGAGSEGGGEAGSGSDGSSSIEVTQTAGFKVTSLTGDFGSVEEINISQQQFLSQNLAANVTFANTADVELVFSALMHLLKIDDGSIGAAPSQEIRLPAVTVAANSKATEAVSNALEVGPGNYTLRIVTDYGAGSAVNEMNITVVDDLAPVIAGYEYDSGAYQRSPRVAKFTIYEHSDITVNITAKGTVTCTDSCTDALTTEPIDINYSAVVVQQGNEKELAVTLYENTDEATLHSAEIGICDESGNCAVSDVLDFRADACEGRHILIAKSYEEGSAFERAAAGLCMFALNKSVSRNPPGSYLKQFDAVIWSTGTDLANIDDADAASLTDYYDEKGRIIVEGSDVAFNHVDDELMTEVLHSELAYDLGISVSSAEDLNNLSINHTQKHPLLSGIETPTFFNASIDPFPDSIKPVNGSGEIAVWDGLEEGGSAIVVYESQQKRSLFLPFSINALNEADRDLLAANAVDWLLADTAIDIVPASLDHGMLFEGPVEFTAVVESSGGATAVPEIKIFVDGNEQDAAAGFGNNGVFEYPVTAELNAGLHKVKVIANSDLAIEENNYINNIAEYELAVYPQKADLIVEGLKYSYDDSEQAVVLEVNVSNMGGTEANSLLRIFADNSEVSSQHIHLASAEKKTVMFTILSDKGNYAYKAVIDPDNTVAEYNESNNELQETLYLCSKSRILVVDDNDAEFYSTEQPSSAPLILDALKLKGYCTSYVSQQEEMITIEAANEYPVLIWSAGDYFDGVLNEQDAEFLQNYDGALLLEGADVALEHAGSSLFEELTGSVHLRDMLLEGEEILLNISEHAITAGIEEIKLLKNDSPYPDSVQPVNSIAVAGWDDGAAITALEQDGRKAVFYGFSADAVENMDALLLNTVEWLLIAPNNAPVIHNVTNITADEGEIVFVEVNATDADGDELTYSISDERFVQNGNRFVWQTNHTDAGEYEFGISVSDGAETAAALINVTVLDVNLPPELLVSVDSALVPQDVPVRYADEGVEVKFSVLATDPDNDELMYEWLINGTAASTTANFTRTFAYNESGTYNVTIRVSDGQDTVSYEFTLIVKDTMQCEPASVQLCAVQEGVCSESTDTCSEEGQWPGCAADTYAEHSEMYEAAETMCDQLDNDCDALTDEGRVCNTAPKLNIANQTVSENEKLQFIVTAADSENDVLHYNAAGLPEGAAFDNETAEFEWTPTYEQAGLYSAGFNVTDLLLWDYAEINITVLETNRPPEFASIEMNDAVDETADAVITVNAVDPDGHEILYSINDSRFAQDGNRFTWTTTYEDAGIHSFLLTISDGDLSKSAVVEVTVTNVNRPPMLNTVGNKTVHEDEKLSFALDAEDADGDLLKYEMVTDAIGASLDSETGLFEWTPDYDDEGKYKAVLVVSDYLLTDYEEINITVLNTNRKPKLTGLFGNYAVLETELAVVGVNAEDPDGDELRYSINDSRFVQDRNAFSWQTGYDDAGLYPVIVTVSDGQDNISVSFEVRVFNLNRPPLLHEIGNRTVKENETLSFTLEADDPDNEPLRFALEMPAELAGVMFDEESGEFEWTPSFSQAGIYRFAFSVTDFLLLDLEEINITVQNVNRPPVIHMILVEPPGTEMHPGEQKSFTVLGSNGNVHYEWLLDGVKVHESSSTYTYKPGADSVGAHVLKVNLTDGEFSTSREIPVTVTQKAIDFLVSGEAEADEGELVRLRVEVFNAADAAIKINDSRFKKSDGTIHGAGECGGAAGECKDPAYECVAECPDCFGICHLEADSLVKLFDWQTGYNDAGGYEILVTVSDGFASASKAVSVVVRNANAPPCGSYGDFNGDKSVTEKDVQMLLDHISGRSKLLDGRYADVNGDGKVNLFDSIYMQHFIGGHINTFPVCN